MFTHTRLTLVLFVVWSVPGWTPANEPIEPKQLLEQLAAKSYRKRQSATQQLLAQGKAALPILQQGLASDNPEQRARCEQLLAILNQSPAEVELALFLHSGEVRNPKLLPGWERFSKLVGSSAADRDFFAMIYSSASPLFLAIDRNPTEAVNLFRTRCTNLQQEMFRNGGNVFAPAGSTVPIAEISALLFVASDERLKLDYAASMMFTFFYNESIRKDLLATGAGQRLLEQFLRVNAAKDATFITQAVNFCTHANLQEKVDKILKPACKDLLQQLVDGKLPSNHVLNTIDAARRLNMPEAKEVALKVIGNPKLDGLTKAMALTTLARVGDRDNVKDVLPLLADKSRIAAGSVNNIAYTTELRDVALICLVKLTKQSPGDYGFAYFKQIPNLNFEHLQPSLCGFATDAERNAALTRFQRWMDENGRK